MTANSAADDGDCNAAITQPASASGVGPALVPATAAAGLPGGGRVAVGKYLRLTAFGLAWAVLNMVLVDSAFELTFKPAPYHIAAVFGASR